MIYPKYDWHIHSKFSTNDKVISTIEQIIEHARNIELECIGITDHVHDLENVERLNIKEYVNSISETIKKCKNGLSERELKNFPRIAIGVEADIKDSKGNISIKNSEIALNSLLP